jgi:hypothetical protein
MAGAKGRNRTVKRLLAELAGAASLAAAAATAFAIAATAVAAATPAIATTTAAAVAATAAAATTAAVAATAAAAAATTAAVAATTAAAAAATTAVAAAPAGLLAGLVDDQAAAFERVAVQCANRGLRRFVGGHRDETESARAAGFAIGDDLGIDDFTVIAE